VIEAVAIALLGLLVAGLLRSHAEILRQLQALNGSTANGQQPADQLPHRDIVSPRLADTAAADIVGETVRGEMAAVAVSGVEHNTLLAFLSSNCATCATLWNDLADTRKAHLPGGARLVVVTKSAEDESLSLVRRRAVDDVVVIMSTDAWTSYEVPGSPYFILVDGPGGRVVGEGSAGRWTEVRDLMGQALDDAHAHTYADAGRGAGPVDRDRADRDRADRVEAELLAAGIGPGHPSLYGDGSSSDHIDERSEPR
jgi:hypothetical protein